MLPWLALYAAHASPEVASDRVGARHDTIQRLIGEIGVDRAVQPELARAWDALPPLACAAPEDGTVACTGLATTVSSPTVCRGLATIAGLTWLVDELEHQREPHLKLEFTCSGQWVKVEAGAAVAGTAEKGRFALTQGSGEKPAYTFEKELGWTVAPPPDFTLSVVYLDHFTVIVDRVIFADRLFHDALGTPLAEDKRQGLLAMIEAQRAAVAAAGAFDGDTALAGQATIVLDAFQGLAEGPYVELVAKMAKLEERTGVGVTLDAVDAERVEIRRRWEDARFSFGTNHGAFLR